MKFNIIPLFYDRLPCSLDEMLPKKAPLLCTFLNPYTAYVSEKEYLIYKQFDKIASDGFLVVLINHFFKKRFTVRVSFDMTSLARCLFSYLEREGMSLYLIGTTDKNIKKAVETIQDAFPNLVIKGYHHGYIKGVEDNIAKIIIDTNPDVVVIGMGALIQDLFAIRLKELGCTASIYTCGGFLHQTVERIDYYPYWINKLHLRTLYRLVKEPYVWKRVIKYYPPFIVAYIKFLLRKNHQS